MIVEVGCLTMVHELAENDFATDPNRNSKHEILNKSEDRMPNVPNEEIVSEPDRMGKSGRSLLGHLNFGTFRSVSDLGFRELDLVSVCRIVALGDLGRRLTVAFGARPIR